MQNQVKEQEYSRVRRCPKEPGFRHKTLEERAMEYDGRLNLDDEYNWGAPVGREIWRKEL